MREAGAFALQRAQRFALLHLERGFALAAGGGGEFSGWFLWCILPGDVRTSTFCQLKAVPYETTWRGPGLPSELRFFFWGEAITVSTD